MSQIMDMRPNEAKVSDRISVETGRHSVARGNVYPLRLLAGVFKFVGFATLIYALVFVGIAIETQIIEL